MIVLIKLWKITIEIKENAPNCRWNWKNISCLAKNPTLETIQELIKSSPVQNEFKMKCIEHEEDCEHFCKDCQIPFWNKCLHNKGHHSHDIGSLKDQFGLHPTAIYEQIGMPLNELSQKLTMEKNCYLRLIKRKEDVSK